MIGVIASETEHAVVREFFELFKTPWEFHRPGASYDVLICAHGSVPENNATLLLLYGAQRQPFEESRGLKTSCISGQDFVSFRGQRIPIYGSCLLFDSVDSELLVHGSTNRSAALQLTKDTQLIVRLGFDLFSEVRHLLTEGQPVELANIPTIELHISLIRELIVGHGVPLVEIPPVPGGYAFLVCLTHDVDHFRLRYHRFDHAMFGFLYRAVIGSLINLCRGRKSLREMLTNWKSAALLPFVYLGLARDPWDQLDRYAELEKDLASTYFVLPRKGHAGIDPKGHFRAKRASRYAAADIAAELASLLSPTSEIALHGIDAWRESAKGREERTRIQEITGALEIGVRMHWLYFNAESPSKLEQAAFSYDSTIGYNETIGYRAGTTQVYKHLLAEDLLELPLHLMDTALFYPSYLDLSDRQARSATLELIQNAAQFGGVLTVNWHDRSLGPERLWANAYMTLLQDLRAKTPWFATATQAVSWFRKRRTISFASVTQDGGNIRVQLTANRNTANLPPLTVRVYNGSNSKVKSSYIAGALFEDFIIDESDELLIAA